MEGYTKIGRIRPVFQGLWSSAKNYTVLDMVRSADGAAVYIALQDVPAGTQLSNAAYWGVAADVTAARDSANAAAAAAKNTPYIGANGNWFIYDADRNAYIDSGNPSRGEGGTGGGSNTPDLVIEMNAPSGTTVDEAAPGWFSVKSGNISNVINMLKNHEEPSIVLEVDFYYWDYRYSGAAKYSSAVSSYQNDRLVISFDVPYSAHPGNMVYICLWFDPSGQLTDVYHASKM